MKASKSSIMYFEPGQFPDALLGFVFQLGFKTPPGAEIGSPNHVLNDHTYCCQLSLDVCATGEPAPGSEGKCKAWHEKRIGTRQQDAERLGVPMIISEFGACLDSDACVTEITQVTDVCDENLAGWAYWEFKPFHDITTSAGDRSEGFYNKDGTLQVPKVKALARTYVKAAQGTTKSMKFHSQASNGVAEGTFTATVQYNASVKLPTEVFLAHPEQNGPQISYYNNGYTVSIVGGPKATV